MSKTFRKKNDWLDGEKATRDKKRGYKPNKKFKQLAKSRRKAKEKQALRENKEAPTFRKEDVWNWI